jgi:hypothetical protein
MESSSLLETGLDRLLVALVEIHPSSSTPGTLTYKGNKDKLRKEICLLPEGAQEYSRPFPEHDIQALLDKGYLVESSQHGVPLYGLTTLGLQRYQALKATSLKP